MISVTEAIERTAAGEMLIVVDDEQRENEGDLCVAADFVTPETINFMIRHARGLVCMPCEPSRLEELRIGPMVTKNTCTHETAFTVSIDLREGGSGISARDRASTIRAVVDPSSRATDFVRPGHVFPLRAREGGVLVRPGHTEASVDLARLAGRSGCAAICEILDDSGDAARLPTLREFAKHHNLGVVSIESLIEHLGSLHAQATVG